MTLRFPNDGSDRAVDTTAWLRAHTDGIVCFGGVDWWYHNRGHYDLQMMRELSAHVPVLYVNSIGMRTPDPREGRQFLSRISRKLGSLRRGLHRADDKLWVLSPPSLPGPAGARFTRPLLVRSVRAAARRAGIMRPLVWIACPPAMPAIGPLGPAAVVYQRTDRYECYDGVDGEAIRALDARLKVRADLTVFCAHTLFEQERDACRAACVVEHGVDERFFVADEKTEPDDLRAIARPRVGFVGGIDAHTFDPELFRSVARRLDDVQFVLVGASSLPADWCELPNVHQLGRRPFAEVPAYLGACDVLIMPWNDSEWIQACSPVKLREYLASGRPVVSTPFPELRQHRDLVRVASTADAFASEIRDALDRPVDAESRRSRVRGGTWNDRAREVVRSLAGAAASTTVTPASTKASGASLPPLRLVGGYSSRVAPPDRIDLAAFVILAGGLRPSHLVTETRRSTLDLWLTAERTVIDTWLTRWTDLGRDPATPVRVVHDNNLPAPTPPPTDLPLTVEREPRPVRGVAGLLRDVCAGYGPDRHVLVVHGARYLDGALDPVVRTHLRHSAAITLAVNPDGTAAGIYVVRCGTLASIASAGFVDLKEQWLPGIVRAGSRVQVHRLDAPGTLPLHTREEFLTAARVAGANGTSRVICPGALVAPGAVVTDSIVMPGAMVQRNTVVSRSILCPDARIPPDRVVADATLRSGEVRYREEPAPSSIPA